MGIICHFFSSTTVTEPRPAGVHPAGCWEGLLGNSPRKPRTRWRTLDALVPSPPFLPSSSLFLFYPSSLLLLLPSSFLSFFSFFPLFYPSSLLLLLPSSFYPSSLPLLPPSSFFIPLLPSFSSLPLAPDYSSVIHFFSSSLSPSFVLLHFSLFNSLSSSSPSLFPFLCSVSLLLIFILLRYPPPPFFLFLIFYFISPRPILLLPSSFSLSTSSSSSISPSAYSFLFPFFLFSSSIPFFVPLNPYVPPSPCPSPSSFPPRLSSSRPPNIFFFSSSYYL